MEVQERAGKYGRTPAQILLRWGLQQGVVPLAKANRKEHFVENLGTFDFRLGETDIERLDAINERYSSLGVAPQHL